MIVAKLVILPLKIVWAAPTPLSACSVRNHTPSLWGLASTAQFGPSTHCTSSTKQTLAENAVCHNPTAVDVQLKGYVCHASILIFWMWVENASFVFQSFLCVWPAKICWLARNARAAISSIYLIHCNAFLVVLLLITVLNARWWIQLLQILPTTSAWSASHSTFLLN